MENVVSFLKKLKFELGNAFFISIFGFFGGLLIFFILGGVISDLQLRHDQLSEIHRCVEFLQGHQARLKFIKQHRFEKSDIAPDKFAELLNDYVKKYRMRLISNNLTEKSTLPSGITTNQYEIELLSWHDRYIFEMLESIQNFPHGFIEILNIDMSRVDRITLNSPAIKVMILCNLYYKH